VKTDQKQTVNWDCRFLIGHVWGKWEIIKTQMTTKNEYSTVQERRCSHCGLRQMKRDVA